MFRKERVRGFARTPAAECFGGRESWERCAHSGSGMFQRERAGGAVCIDGGRSVVRIDGGRSADCARKAVRGLSGAVTDCTAMDVSSVRAHLLRSLLAFLQQPQVPPSDPHPCPPSLDLRRDKCTLDRVTLSLASVVCPMT